MLSASREHRRGYTRLTGQDAAFLSFEGPGRPMHIGALAFVSNNGWLDETGDLDTNRLRDTIADRAGAVPGLDRVLHSAPLTGWPLWISDPAIDWEAQVQILPAASHEAEVREIAEKAMATPLDRSRPLWRVVIMPGAPGSSRFALAFLAHHSLVDGIAGIDLLAQLLDRHDTLPARAPHHRPPSRNQLLADELIRVVEVPRNIANAALGAVTNQRRRRRLVRRATALVRTAVRLLTPGPTTLLRGENEGTRSVSWFSVEDRPLRLARQRLNGTPNDLVMAAVASAINSMPGKRSPLHFRKLRAAIPVSFRTRAERYNLGNRIGLQIVPLDPKNGNLGRAVAEIHKQTLIQKHRGDAEGYEVLTQLTAWLGRWSQRLLHWLAGKVHSYGILITNVPGPSRSYTLGGASIEEIYPLVPLFGSQSLSVAVVRYGGYLRVGVTSSWGDAALVDTFTQNLQQAFAQIALAPKDAMEPAGAPVPMRQGEARA
ncbi:MAG: wax ester/triacylglycerol synthase domain-containing protein [bacterium]